MRLGIMAAGAIGSNVGGMLARAGHDVTLIDQWPAHVEAIKANGLRLGGTWGDLVAPVKALHLYEAQGIQEPFDNVFLAVKGYDTEWATQLIAQYLAPHGFVVSLPPCINEERIASIVGWGKTLGVAVSLLAAELIEPGHVIRTVPLGGKEYTIFRAGEVHGRVTDRAKDLLAKGQEQGQQVLNQAQQLIEQSRGKFEQFAQEQPILVAALGVAFGAALGATLPLTKAEQQYLGDPAKKAASKAGELAHQAADTVTDKLAGANVAHKVSEVVEAVSSTVTQGLSRS